MVIIHIASLQRIKMLFTLSGLCAVDFTIAGLRRTCCGKVNLIKDNKYETGYIIEEKGSKWKIMLSTNKYINVQKVPMVRDRDGNFERYEYKHNSKRKWTVTMYWPIKMKFLTNDVENWKFMLNHISFKDGKVVPQLIVKIE